MRKNIKRILAAPLLALMVISPLVSYMPSEAATCRLNKKKVTITTGSSCKIAVNGSTKRVTWKSSNKKVATVSKNGKVFAKKAGKAKITATISKKKLICKVTVNKKDTTTVCPTKVPQATKAPQVTQAPQTTQTPPSQQTITENTAYSTLNTLRNTYPEGMTLTNADYYYSPVFGRGYGCYGFAAKLSDTIFGTQKSYATHSTFSKIKVGDNIRIGNYHSVIVLTKSNNYITVVEGNYNSSVHWDRKITSASLASEGFTVFTRY